jgi:hypothetical protein
VSAGRRDRDGAYPPLDVLKPVAEDVFVVDGAPLRLLGLVVPVRMSVVRLSDGGMWLHSPTRHSPALQAEIERHGPIAHLVAPDVAHWTFLPGWQRACPQATTFAAPGLRERKQVKRSGVRIDHVLAETAAPAFGSDLDQVVVRGIGFAEVDFFHRASRTLILTDLVQNLETEGMPLPTRIFARLNGVAAPTGRAPLYLRAAILAKRRQAARAAATMLAFAPERVIFSHGRWFERDGAAALRRSLDWLLPESPAGA